MEWENNLVEETSIRLGETSHFSMLLVYLFVYFCHFSYDCIVAGCQALATSPPPHRHLAHRQQMRDMRAGLTLSGDTRRSDNRSFPSSWQEAKWLWFITLMHICLLAHGVFVCQLLKTHKPSTRVIFLFKQEGLAVLQQKHSKQLLPSLLFLPAHPCMLISQTVLNSSWRGPRHVASCDLSLLHVFFKD